VKSLLNITVFASAVLSIFSTSLTLYEVPELKKALSVEEEENSSHKSESATEMKRIYISHDVSGTGKNPASPKVATKDSGMESKSAEDSINVFGVLVSRDKGHRNT